MIPQFRAMQPQIDIVNRVLREQIAGVRVVRAFVREPAEAARFDDANAELTDTALRVGRLQALMFPTVMLVFNASTGRGAVVRRATGSPSGALRRSARWSRSSAT